MILVAILGTVLFTTLSCLWRPMWSSSTDQYYDELASRTLKQAEEDIETAKEKLKKIRRLRRDLEFDLERCR